MRLVTHDHVLCIEVVGRKPTRPPIEVVFA
jgi:hypothetical protein